MKFTWANSHKNHRKNIWYKVRYWWRACFLEDSHICQSLSFITSSCSWRVSWKMTNGPISKFSYASHNTYVYFSYSWFLFLIISPSIRWRMFDIDQRSKLSLLNIVSPLNHCACQYLIELWQSDQFYIDIPIERWRMNEMSYRLKYKRLEGFISNLSIFSIVGKTLEETFDGEVQWGII